MKKKETKTSEHGEEKLCFLLGNRLGVTGELRYTTRIHDLSNESKLTK